MYKKLLVLLLTCNGIISLLTTDIQSARPPRFYTPQYPNVTISPVSYTLWDWISGERFTRSKEVAHQESEIIKHYDDLLQNDLFANGYRSNKTITRFKDIKNKTFKGDADDLQNGTTPQEAQEALDQYQQLLDSTKKQAQLKTTIKPTQIAWLTVLSCLATSLMCKYRGSTKSAAISFGIGCIASMSLLSKFLANSKLLNRNKTIVQRFNNMQTLEWNIRITDDRQIQFLQECDLAEIELYKIVRKMSTNYDEILRANDAYLVPLEELIKPFLDQLREEIEKAYRKNPYMGPHNSRTIQPRFNPSSSIIDNFIQHLIDNPQPISFLNSNTNEIIATLQKIQEERKQQALAAHENGSGQATC